MISVKRYTLNLKDGIYTATPKLLAGIPAGAGFKKFPIQDGTKFTVTKTTSEIGTLDALYLRLRHKLSNEVQTPALIWNNEWLLGLPGTATLAITE